MSKKYLFTDLDNTLMYSINNRRNKDIFCVEKYKGSDFSFISLETEELLKEIETREDIELIPITTRSLRQFGRVHLPTVLNYSLCENGTLVNKSGTLDLAYAEEYMNKMGYYIQQLKGYLSILYTLDNKYVYDIREIGGLYIVFKVNELNEDFVSNRLNVDKNVFVTYRKRNKYYIIPNFITKGECIKTFMKYYNLDGDIYCAGDSEIDKSMSAISKEFYCPDTLELVGNNIVSYNRDIFTESFLERILML